MLTQDFKPSIPAKFNLLSTDVKPTDCPNGSRINEIDTGKVYLFDEENKVWYEKPNSGGGGGGGGSVTVDTTVNGASANPVQNKAIYDFVNSSVATNTANFIGTFNSVAELNGYSGTVTNNDYAFVVGADSAGNTVYNRYKYNGSAWGFEYALNNSSFTAAQWATIQSGLTASDKTKLDGIETGANKTVVDENLSATSTNPVQNKTVNTALAAKQDTITDLTNIRSGATAGSTAVQPADMSAALTVKQDKLTFDSAPTESSTNPVTSGGVWTDQQRQEAEIGVVANAGAKNLLRNEKNAGATVERQGATWVFDQTSVEAKVSGSVSTAWSDVYLLNSNLDLSDKEYKVVVESDSPNLFIYIPGNTLSGGNIPSNGQYYPGVYKYKGIMTTSTRFTAKTASYSNNTIRCMICPASITDDTFVPYAKTNHELTVENASQQSEIDYAVNSGAKNFLDIQHPTTTTRTSYTPLSNGGVELSCSSAIWTSYNIADIPVEAGKEYIITFFA